MNVRVLFLKVSDNLVKKTVPWFLWPSMKEFDGYLLLRTSDRSNSEKYAYYDS